MFYCLSELGQEELVWLAEEVVLRLGLVVLPVESPQLRASEEQEASGERAFQV